LNSRLTKQEIHLEFKFSQMGLFHNKYRIESTRLKKWDYGWNAAYFITICTKNRESFFGSIRNGRMFLSKIGQIVKKEWTKTFEMRPDMNLTMDEFVVMPNHFHAIIIIGRNEYNARSGGNHQQNSDAQRGGECRDAMHCVSSQNAPNPQPPPNPLNQQNPINKFGPQRKNLPSIIRGFKTAVTCKARKINPDFGWQSRYHDHVIRDDADYYRIKNYIRNNPQKWDEDIFYNK